MLNSYSTSRLLLNKLSLQDADFIFELVNTPEWKAFIGERNLNTIEDAIKYVQKIMSNQSIDYWIVRSRESNLSLGIITFIKREYLDHHDIGFAFLKKYTGKEFAFEAAAVVLSDAMKYPEHSSILATTVKENKRSIRLLERLGLQFLKEIQIENEVLLVYSIDREKNN